MHAAYPVNSIINVESGQSYVVRAVLPQVNLRVVHHCPVCKKGGLVQAHAHKERTVGELIYLTPMVFDICTAESCGVILFTTAQSKFNRDIESEFSELVGLVDC